MAADLERSRRWELEHSWWLALIVLSFGFLTWAAFGYIGLRTGRRRWVVWASFYLALLVPSFLLLDYDLDTWQATIGTVGVIVCWAGGFVHGLAIRGDVLDRLSADEDPRVRQARRRLTHRAVAGEVAAENPALAREAGIGADPSAFGGLVDVNSASAEQFATLPGISRELADRIVETRESVDGFDSVLDFATLLDLPPRFVDSIRDRLICLPR